MFTQYYKYTKYIVKYKKYFPAIRPSVSLRHPHTTWLHYNETEVNNIYETPVTQQQILGRSLTHAFTVASAYAKQLHGVCSILVIYLGLLILFPITYLCCLLQMKNFCCLLQMQPAFAIDNKFCS